MQLHLRYSASFTENMASHVEHNLSSQKLEKIIDIDILSNRSGSNEYARKLIVASSAVKTLGIPLKKFDVPRNETSRSTSYFKMSNTHASHLRTNGAGAWRSILFEVADKDKVVIFTVGTYNYIRIMNTFFNTAIKGQGIQNFLFVALSSGMCNDESSVGALDATARCFQYPVQFSSGGSYGSEEFAKVVQIKSEILLSIIREGYTALLTDADIFYLKNPLPTLSRIASTRSTDLVIQDDAGGGRNSGFMYVKPTSNSASFLSEVVSLQRKNPKMRQQVAVNQVLKSSHRLQVHVLPSSQWPCGVVFFQREARRMFPWHHRCESCLVVHNNWIVGDDAKEYRAKEFL